MKWNDLAVFNGVCWYKDIRDILLHQWSHHLYKCEAHQHLTSRRSNKLSFWYPRKNYSYFIIIKYYNPTNWKKK